MKRSEFRLVIIKLLMLFPVVCLAAETKFDIGPALGNDVAAFAKAFGVEINPADAKNNIWFKDVPALGRITLSRTPKSSAITGLTIRFPDKTISSWEMAFAKLGLPTNAKTVKQGTNFVSLTFLTASGKTCEAWYYKIDEEENTGLPVIEFIVK